MELVEAVTEAHGGIDLWRSASVVSVKVTARGLAFSLKGQGRAITDVEGTVSTEGQQVTLRPYSKPGQLGEFDSEVARIIDGDGGTVSQRPVSSTNFSSLRHLVRWDALDMLIFAGSALWTYISIPFVLNSPEYSLRRMDPWEEAPGQVWDRLAVTLPSGISSHCREQILYFDSRGHLRRHDYTAEALGRWAKAAHYCYDEQLFNGMLVPTRRVVYPRLPNNKSLSRPVLVKLEIGDVILK